MGTITPKQLTAINLKFGRTANSLKALAFAHLVAKALFFYGNKKTIEELAAHVAKLLDIQRVSKELVLSGLNELKQERKVDERFKKWFLNNDARKEIDREAEMTKKKIEAVIKRHFPLSIDNDILEAWLNDALVDFFDHHGDGWVASISKGQQDFKSNLTLNDLLKSSIEKAKLYKDAEELERAFKGLLLSTFNKDQTFLANISFAMFSARLVAADVGADPITIDELRGSMFLVDTNFLFALHLDNNRFADSLKVLGSALNDIGVKLVYIDETKEEYNRVLGGRKNEILKLLEIYKFEVIKETDDDFIKTALLRKCQTIDDFERFFSSLSNLPSCVPNGPVLSLHQDEKVLGETIKAKQDIKLKRLIQEWNIKLKPFWNKTPKSESALNHDASLICVTEFEKRSGNKTFILTLDRSLQATSAQRSGHHEIPHAIYLGGLIQILAAHNAGPNLDATNFAPLMSNMLKRCLPPEHTFTAQDLHWLYKIQKNIAQLPPERTKVIALEVAKGRMAGKNADDKGLERTINRLYQEEIQNTDQKVEESLNRATAAEEKMEDEKQKRIALEKQLAEKDKEDQRRSARRCIIKSFAWRIPLALILVYVAYHLVNLQALKLESNGFWNFFITIIEFLCFIIALLKKPVETYGDDIKKLK